MLGLGELGYVALGIPGVELAKDLYHFIHRMEEVRYFNTQKKHGKQCIELCDKLRKSVLMYNELYISMNEVYKQYANDIEFCKMYLAVCMKKSKFSKMLDFTLVLSRSVISDMYFKIDRKHISEINEFSKFVSDTYVVCEKWVCIENEEKNK